MTARQRIENSGLNLNSILLIVSIIGAIVTTVFFFAPLRTLPGDMKEIQVQMQSVQHVQAVQTAALQTLADVSKDVRETRKDLDKSTNETQINLNRHTYEIEGAKRRLDRLEQEP